MARIDDLCVKTLMMLSVDAVQRANSGHPGMPMGDATMAYVLWSKYLKHNPKNPKWHNRDRFVLSAGHGSMLLYSLLYMSGHDVSLDEIKNFRQWESKTPGHPEYCLDCGIETTTGPLGQGFATGVGMAMAERYLAGLFNKKGFPLIDYNIFGILSDGDLMEGISSESASLAGHLGLGKIVYLYSDNNISIEGSTSLAFTEDVEKRFKAFNWHTQHVDGYDQRAIASAIAKAKAEKGKPSIILVKTHIGYKSPHKQDTADAHGSPLGKEEIALVRKALGWPNKEFHVPQDALRHMRGALKKGASSEKKWQDMFKRYSKKHPKLAALWDDLSAGRLPEGWDESVPVFKTEDGDVATRSASGKFLNAVAAKLPNLIGGSADLAPSNNTWIKGAATFTKKEAGRNIHFGVREHAMGAAMNGMALSNMIIPYCGTFLIFTDYMRPATRLSALMGVHAVYVMTHDSIGLGEDGPTHQPIEHLASYRAMPNMMVLRPADANETVEAWRVALNHKGGPVMLALSRQNLTVLDRKKFPSASNIKKGAYVVYGRHAKPDLIMISSGAELHVTLEAAKALEAEKVKVNVVNMASMELFEAQGVKYRESVLPSSVRARLAVEAASGYGWQKYVGLDGDVIGMERFGASAPAKVLFSKFGFTAENIAKRAKALIKK